MDIHSFCHSLRALLQEIITDKRKCADFNQLDCSQLLAGDKDIQHLEEEIYRTLYYTTINSLDTSHLENIIAWLDELRTSKKYSVLGLPMYPLVQEIAKAFAEWAATGEFPVKLVSMFMLNEVEDDKARLQGLTPYFMSKVYNWSNKDEKERIETMADIFENLGKKGICTILKMRITQGSILSFPVGMGALLRSCNKLHAPHSSSKLTVAGRALSKHAQRSMDGWWGVSEGPEYLKNARAEKLILHIMRNAAWINIHALPHELHILEIRVKEGYGMRWLADGSQFRGFLEPQMPDGHEKGWIH